MRAGLARARLNSRRRRSALPLAGAELRLLDPATDEALATLVRDFHVVSLDDGTFTFQVVESAVDAEDLEAAPSVALRPKTGASFVRYANGNRVPPVLTSKGYWEFQTYAPVGIYTPPATEGFPYTFPMTFP